MMIVCIHGQVNHHNCKKLEQLVRSAAMYIAVAFEQSCLKSKKHGIIKRAQQEIALLTKVSLPRHQISTHGFGRIAVG